jgi:hypothetical protein
MHSNQSHSNVRTFHPPKQGCQIIKALQKSTSVGGILNKGHPTDMAYGDPHPIAKPMQGAAVGVARV